MYTERTIRIALDWKQANEIRIALEERIKYLKRCQERCWECEIASENPIFRREYKKMGKTYAQWIKDIEKVLEHLNTETSEIKP